MKTLTQYFVPEWVSNLFLIMIPLPFILILLFLHKSAKEVKSNKSFIVALVFYICYVSYICYAGINGWFNDVFFPPKVLLMATFPYGLLLFVVVSNTSTFKKILDQTSLDSLVSLHIFRVVGVFFVILALHNALPKAFAFIAGFGDIIAAFSSIIVVRAIRAKKHYAQKITFFWNVFGTIDILFTAIAAIVLTKISINTGSMGVDTLAFFPFCIIPAFAPPTILFLHWCIFKKLKEYNR